MNTSFDAVKVSDRVYWVGAIDWSVRDFHGYLTQRGSTYNAYLVLADKITLIDTVKAPFVGEMLARIASVVEPERIQYIVSNHSEMDHSGGLPQAIEAVQPEKIFASANGAKALAAHFHLDHEITAVPDGGTIDLGSASLACFETKMLHWPDSMISYFGADQLLFSQDAFGMHLASGERFADELDPAILEAEARKYYANILLPLSPLVTKAIERLTALNVPLKIIAPDHGPIWRRDLDWITGRYAQWAQQQPAKKAVIVFDTMWESTAKMAHAIAEGVTAGGATPLVLKLRANHRSDIVTHLLDAGALIVGSPTINNTLFPTVADFLAYARGLKPRNLVGAAFGSYGWSGEATRQIRDVLQQMDVELVADDLKVRYVPDAEASAQCHALGRHVAEKLMKR